MIKENKRYNRIYKTGNYSLESAAKAATSILGYLASRRTIY